MTERNELPDNPENLLPSDSMLSLDEYLEMMQVAGTRPGFLVTYTLLHNDPMQAAQLRDTTGLGTDEFHRALDALRATGLVTQEMRPEDDVLRYRATVLSETLLTEGVLELMRREYDFSEAYSSE